MTRDETSVSEQNWPNTLFLESSFYMGIQFPPIAFLYQLYLYINIYIYIYIYIYIFCCALVRSIIEQLNLKPTFQISHNVKHA